MESKEDDYGGRFRRLKRFFVELNVFDTNSTDETTVKIERWSSRLYIVLLCLSMSILLVYNGLHVERVQVEVKNPSLETYRILSMTFDDSVIKCPCTQISSLYDSFVQLTPTYHDICSSIFISQGWIEAFFDNMTSMRYFMDFRASASLQFQLLREICDISQTTFNNYIEAFYNDEFISGDLVGENVFEAQIATIVNSFRSNTISKFFNAFSLSRLFLTENRLSSGIQQDLTYAYYSLSSTDLVVAVVDSSVTLANGGTCYCGGFMDCHLMAGFYDFQLPITIDVWSTYTPTRILEDWSLGCYAMDALLSTSIDRSFLNNQTALDIVVSYLSNSSLLNIIPLIALNESKVNNQNSTLSDIIQSTMLLKNLKTEVNYSLYFGECRPKSCYYTINQHYSFLYMFTTFFGLYGGLTVVLRLIIPLVTAFLIRRFFRKMPATVPASADPVMVETATWKKRTRKMAIQAWVLLRDLNLFKSSVRQHESDIRQQRWTTRIYVLLHGLSVGILVIYTMVDVEIKSIEVNNPSITTVEYLQSQSANGLISSLQCPCTQLIAPYGSFLRVQQPSYHQACSSALVSSSWIGAVNDAYPGATSKYHLDFGYSATLFQTLASLCTFSNQTIFQSLTDFEQTELVTAQLITHDIFDIQVASAIMEFELETINSFLRFLQVQRNISFLNQIMGGPFKNIQVHIINSSVLIPVIALSWYNISTYNCSCANDSSCRTIFGVYDYTKQPVTLLYSVPGLYLACSNMESLLISTLECFYDNSDCLNTLVKLYNNTRLNITRLNSSPNASRFAVNATVGDLLSQLFIESWNISSIYSSYFDQCQPTSCTYKISRRNNAIETVTRITALIGGLSISLKILVFLLMTIIAYFICKRQQQEAVEPIYSIVILGRNIYDWLKNLNTFDNITNNNTVEQQRRTTRVYLVLLIITLFILILNNLLVYSSHTNLLLNPSLDQYQQLEQQFGVDAISCPCSQLSISYASFIELTFDLHEVCASQFVSNLYIQNLFQIYTQLNNSDPKLIVFTLQGTVFSYFQGLATLCSIANATIHDGHQQFLSSSIVSAYMIDIDLFNKQTNAALNQFQSTLPQSYLNSLQLLRGFTQGNGLVSAFSTNWYLQTYYVASLSPIYFHPQHYGNCSCATSAACTQPSIPFIPGYLVGCTPVESLLRSTIECLYDQSCVDLLAVSLNISLPSPVISLNKTATHFSLNDTIESIAGQLFIETRLSNISYNNFFKECQPLTCYVTIIAQNGFLIVMITILGLYGGLVAFLRLIVPWFLSIIEKLMKKLNRKRQVNVRVTTDMMHT